MKKMADVSRRDFLKTAAAGSMLAGKVDAAGRIRKRPNILFILCDQLGIDAISGHGNKYVETPNIDRLIRRGTTFMESHSTNPVCSPARSSLFTGRMPVETGVTINNQGIAPGMPNSGEWLRKAGYYTAYCGKWHVWVDYPQSDDDMLGFRVLPSGRVQGDIEDSNVSRACESFIYNYDRSEPFFLTASFMQPHDICFWGIPKDRGEERLLKCDIPFEHYGEKFGMPPLPPNNKAFPRAPQKLAEWHSKWKYTDKQWRYYLYIYYRMTEMLDAEVGRLLDALEDTGKAENTLIIFTSDHGDGNARHNLSQKWYPYEESVKVPLVVSWPGRVKEGHSDAEHLVSGLDIISTMCDYAGCEPPPNARGASLRPFLEEDREVPWRDFLVTEHQEVGRMVRSRDFKYVKYEGDPVEMLFDIRNDPWETKNLYDDPAYAETMKEHRRMLAEWNDRMIVVEPSPVILPWSPVAARKEWIRLRREKAEAYR